MLNAAMVSGYPFPVRKQRSRGGITVGLRWVFFCLYVIISARDPEAGPRLGTVYHEFVIFYFRGFPDSEMEVGDANNAIPVAKVPMVEIIFHRLGSFS